MGYLSDNLPFGRGIADCPSFYIYAMFVYFSRRDKFSADSPQTIVAKTILEVLPDVEDWQVSVVRNDHVVFRFHDPAQRQSALDAVTSNTPIELAIDRVTFTSQGSTVLPSGQVFPAPPPPPPPFPDLGPIIGDLETRVHQLELDEEHEVPPTPGKLDAAEALFDFASPSVIDFDVAAAGDSIIDVDVVIENAFDDPATTIAFGTIADPGSILPSTAIDPTTIGTYNNSGDFPIATTTGLRLQLSAGASTQGSGRVIVTIRRQ